MDMNQNENQQNSNEPPSLFKQAVNFTKSAAEHIADGMKNTEKTQQEERMDICRGCEFFIEETERCSKCGCYLQLKTKWRGAKCPLKKW